MDIFEPDFDFDALNPAFADLGAIIDEVDEYIEELDMELMEGETEDDLDGYYDENGVWRGDSDEVDDPEPSDDFPMWMEYDED